MLSSNLPGWVLPNLVSSSKFELGEGQLKTLAAIITTLRPKQWIKNLIIFTAYLFSFTSRQFSVNSEIDLLIKVLAGFILFSLASSIVYLINDVIDKNADSLHPTKKNRPIASGLLPVPVAISVAGVIFAVTAVLSYMGYFAILNIQILYLILFTLYSFYLKKVVVLDVLLIAVGFVLRAVAGAAVISQGISVWLVICTIFLALFLGFSKRRSELSDLEERADKHRKTLKEYNVPLLDLFVGITATSTIITYVMYCLSARTIVHVGHDGLITLPIVIFGIFRYLYLVAVNNEGTDPAVVLLSDIPLMASVFAWLAIWVALILTQPHLLNSVLVI
jgi:4-hydroxybenzoate polyprenyltransferase